VWNIIYIFGMYVHQQGIFALFERKIVINFHYSFDYV